MPGRVGLPYPDVNMVPGQMLAHYSLLERLGAGGMGVVYKALDTHLNRTVAIKLLPSDAVADPSRRQRFIQETRAASALHHPNIIDGIVLALSERAGNIWMAKWDRNEKPGN